MTQIQPSKSPEFSPVIQRPMPYYQHHEQRPNQPSVPVSTAQPCNQHFLPSSYHQPAIYASPKCKLNCKCCAKFLMTGEECTCNKYKITVATQTDQIQLNFDKADYFQPKTSAYKLMQVCIFLFL